VKASAAEGKAQVEARVAAALGELRAHAGTAMERAYAPYSHFRVGAALLTADGFIADGCNVESAAFPAGVCAERVALGSAVTAGHREFLALAIATEADQPTPPCGTCRQALMEFGADLVVLSTTRGGQEARWTLGELLPIAFTPTALGRGGH
jgi:cytidine deaminase